SSPSLPWQNPEHDAAGGSAPIAPARHGAAGGAQRHRRPLEMLGPAEHVGDLDGDGAAALPGEAELVRRAVLVGDDGVEPEPELADAELDDVGAQSARLAEAALGDGADAHHQRYAVALADPELGVVADMVHVGLRE